MAVVLYRSQLRKTDRALNDEAATSNTSVMTTKRMLRVTNDTEAASSVKRRLADGSELPMSCIKDFVEHCIAMK